MCRKLFLLTSFLLVLALVSTNVALADVIEIPIATDDDDVEEHGDWDGGAMESLTSNDLEMPYEDTGMDEKQIIGLRYTDITIPKGATITAAWVQFQVDDDEDGTLPVNLIIEGELSANAAGFTSDALNVTSRPRTTAQVQWSVPNWATEDEQGPDQATSDIAAVIQEIVNQDGWASGNALVLIISDDPSNPSEGIRCAEAGPGDDSAFLHVEFGAAPAALPEGWQSRDIGTTGGSAAESDGTWAISADGEDIWWRRDEFHYAYVPLSGDGTIIARVVSNGEGSDGWAKGGVMIRESLNWGSKHAIMFLTGGEGGGMAFQNRQESGGISFSSHGDPTAAPPYWVKLTRVGNTITGYSSADGVEWVQQPDGTGGDMTTNPVDIEMATNVYIGLFVTSHASGEVRTYTFDNVSIETPGAMDNWEAAVAVDAPGFLATNVPDDLYDIGTFSGDITYEFCVKSNPDETEASMCLIGRRQFGDTQAGLKFDQWNDTGEYGATLFGVVDLYYGVPYSAGVDTHLVWVSSEDAGTTALYENGVYKGSVDAAITLFGLVGIGYGAQGEDASGAFNDFDGDIFGVAIYDTALSDEQIAAHADAFLGPRDVTAPGDTIQGVPNDGDWPGAETPDLAIDDDIETKYRHFKGDFDPDPGTGGAGFQVTPLVGPTIVSGLTFTTANDFPGRDPIAFELSGSNEGIDGPYELIASGDIIDFAQALAWPRLTMNITPISFDNDTAYAHYQLIFTAIRGPVGGSINSMQIAEVELLGIPAPAPGSAHIILVTEEIDRDWDGLRDDHSLESFLISEGHSVDVRPEYWNVLTPEKKAELNAADLIIVSRLAWSSRYNQGNEKTEWNSLTTPLLLMNSHFARNNRWKWVNSDAREPEDTSYIYAGAVDQHHPIFQGVQMTLYDPTLRGGPLNAVEMIDPLIGTGFTAFIDGTDMGNGRIIAKPVGLEAGWIAEWDVGVEFFDGAGQYAGGRRMLFCAGTRVIHYYDDDRQQVIPTVSGELNLTAGGLQMFRNAIEYLL